MRIQPWGDLVLVEVEEAPTQTPGGLFVPEQARRSGSGRRAKVLAVGPGRWLSPTEREPMDVKEGDVVVLANLAGAGKELEYNGRKCCFVHEIDVVAILPPEELAQAAAA